MNYIKRPFLKLGFLFFLALTQGAYCTQSILVYRDFGYKGDENQILGVLRAYKQHYNDIEVSSYNVGDEEKLIQDLKEKAIHDPKPIVLAVGEKTINPYVEFLPREDARTVHLCHMVTKDHPKLIGKVDYIALPTHAIGDFETAFEQTQTQLIRTVGVSHNRQSDESEKAYAKRKASLPEGKRFMGVVLSGDAPSEDKTIHLFTQENAQELARYIASILKDQHLLITNGPRTGKHDPKTLTEIATAHRGGMLDYVTHAFKEELIKSGVEETQFTLFDFQFGPPSSDMDLIFGAVGATGGTMLVAGESSSSISESIDVLVPGSVTAYYTTSMNSTHEAHIKSELLANRLKYLPQGYGEIVQHDEASGLELTPSAAETIALALLKK